MKKKFILLTTLLLTPTLCWTYCPQKKQGRKNAAQKTSATASAQTPRKALKGGSNLIYLQKGQKLDDMIAQKRNVVLYFYGDDCAPCRAMAPELEAVVAEYPHVTFIKVNTSVDEFIPYQLKYDIRGIPALIIYKEGKQVTPILDPKDKTMRLYIGMMRKADELREIFNSVYR
jgi:thioredoxin 1